MDENPIQKLAKRKRNPIEALMQFMQSASNAAASNVSGPVDLIGAGLRYAGVPVPENAIGSSQWMAERGLTQPVPQNAASLAGETFGLASPIAAAAKAPQIAGGLLKMGENAAITRQLNPQTGAIVYPQNTKMFDLSGLTRDQQRTLLAEKAEQFAAPLRAKGFEVTIEQSGSAAGPSFYARIFDPQTNRFIKDPARFSGHGKGPFGSGFVYDMDDALSSAPRLYELADEMRSRGPVSLIDETLEAKIAAKRARNLARQKKKSE